MSYPPDPHVRCKNTCPHGDCGECLPLKTEPCAYPPPGWQCSRGRDHTGPCAARPSWWNLLWRWRMRNFR